MAFERKCEENKGLLGKKTLSCPYFVIFTKNGPVLKTLVFPILSILLMGCFLASPLIPFLDKELGKTMVFGSSEEEKSSKKEEAEKNFDELDLYLKNYNDISFFQVPQQRTLCSLGYVFPTLELSMEILDPPPKKLI